MMWRIACVSGVIVPVVSASQTDVAANIQDVSVLFMVESAVNAYVALSRIPVGSQGRQEVGLKHRATAQHDRWPKIIGPRVSAR